MDLNTAEDPMWTFFDSQHKYITDQMNTAYKTAVAKVQGRMPHTRSAK